MPHGAANTWGSVNRCGRLTGTVYYRPPFRASRGKAAFSMADCKVLDRVGIATVKERIMAHIRSAGGADYTTLGHARVVYEMDDWVWSVSEDHDDDGNLDRFEVQWRRRGPGRVQLGPAPESRPGMMGQEMVLPVSSPVATLRVHRVGEPGARLCIERHADAACPPLTDLLRSLGECWPALVGREGTAGAPTVRPPRPAKPPPGAGLDAWFDWYHAMKGAGLKCTLKDLAQDTGYSEGHIKHEHRSYKLRCGRPLQRTH
jgi:hypothetical protein